MMKKNQLLRGALALLLILSMLLPMTACNDEVTNPTDTTDTVDTSDYESASESDTEEDTSEDPVDVHTYDFYITLGTMPTLYATLHAYERQNPNTYMWFLRGNTISYEYSADFIQYFSTQSQTNASSEVNWALIRDKVKEIKAADPEAKFHLYCDDLRVSFIPHIFVYAGVDFEDLRVTFLSDGTGTYNNYSLMTDSYYAGYASTWSNILETYEKGRDNADFVPPYEDTNQSMQDLQYLAFYVSTFENVDFWVQNPAYLLNDHAAVTAARENMHIVEKNPAEMYANLADAIRADYQKVVLANALVDSDTLTTLEDAVAYFDAKLSGRDKEIVLILGTNKKTLDENKFYIDETLNYYTPTVTSEDATKVTYKGKTYTIEAGAATVTVDGKELKIGELGVYLFFKGHPAHPADETLQGYFADHGIETLPHRTPVETLFWMYDVKVGGYQSTSFLSCYKGQTEFIYEKPDAEAIVQMMNIGFFEGCAIFEAPVEEESTPSAS
ncbi:MAG: hypothetical protein IJD38_02675 [Clostridia bacterium]|nr:hypothetical protein [Clostridia bacterium]